MNYVLWYNKTDADTKVKRMETYELSKQYLSPDFPEKYRDQLVNEMSKEEEFFLKILHGLFNLDLYKGETMVEFGCGPTIHKLASASKYYSNIITSDYAPANREAIRKWLNADPECLDWTPFLEKVAKMEDYSNLRKGIMEIEQRIRRAVKRIVHCDALEEYPLPCDIKDVDLLLTTGCLESVCPTIGCYMSAVKKLGKYIRCEGSLIMIVAIEMNSVPIDKKEVKVLNVDLETVERALREAGFRRQHLYYKKNEEKKIEFAGFAIITGIKQ